MTSPAQMTVLLHTYEHNNAEILDKNVTNLDEYIDSNNT